ncbi:MAG: hypothetical protein M1821_002288 [Bathelium mastoideum]|nr:MAG: hypothetical protein M1821_002288 [Bathelium mastoideum]KAI9685762.1 MAG: hypothetical protein M1822_004322 [Bathelium mastoideum]
MDDLSNKKRKHNGSSDVARLRQNGGKRQKKNEYHSSSEEESTAHSGHTQDKILQQDVAASQDGEEQSLDESSDKDDDDDMGADVDEDEGTEATDESSEVDASSNGGAETRPRDKKRKRNDPDAFATSISKILGSKLTTSKRADPVLSRSKEASQASKQQTDSKLEARARNKLREEKRAALEKGRVKDVLGLQSTDTSTADIIEEERRLRKIAQRGVVKLFNAVRAAQIKGEEAAKEARKGGMVGMNNRQERVNEMSKKGFLELIAAGGNKPAAPAEAT